MTASTTTTFRFTPYTSVFLILLDTAGRLNASGRLDCLTQHTPSELVRIEAQALLALADRLEGPMSAAFDRAVDCILQCGQARGRVVVTGMGKSGIIAQKIAATLSSTGSPALFLHPAEAVHGDLGMLARGDVVIALSASGETEEILRLLATIKRIGDALISFCCNTQSTLAQASDICLDVSVPEEACGMNLAPTFRIWDRLFGTYVDPDRVPDEFALGLGERVEKDKIPRMLLGV